MGQHLHDPTTLLARARSMLNAYAHARMMLTQGTRLGCVDETTSIQAREAVMAPDPPLANAPMRQSPCDHRRGARQWMTGWSVADGPVMGFGTERTRVADFQHVVTTVLLPEAIRRQVQMVVLIVENGSTHTPTQVAAWVQSQTWLVAVQNLWLPPHAAWLDQRAIWWKVLPRTPPTPNHVAGVEAL